MTILSAPTQVGLSICRAAIFSALVTAAAAAQTHAQCDCVGALPESCKVLKASYPAIFVGTVLETQPKFRFRVSEKIKGVTTDTFELDHVPCRGIEFQLGKQYLVFAEPLTLSDGTVLMYAYECGHTTEVKYAQAILEQLHAEKNGQRNASLYGMLWRTACCYGPTGDAYDRPLPGVTIKLQSDRKSFEATTDELGTYHFGRLPADSYDISVTGLPPGLTLSRPFGQSYNTVNLSLDFPAHTCFEHDLSAVPSASISGLVSDPDGVPLKFARVYLQRVDEPVSTAKGSADQGNGQPFTFDSVTPGDYVLVFNPMDSPDPAAPFHRTFYPSAPDFEHAMVIYLQEGQQFSNADIHLTSRLPPSRKFVLRVEWNGRNPNDFSPVAITLQSTKSDSPYVEEVSNRFYSVSIFLDATYTFQAKANCKDSRGKVESDPVTIDGSNASLAYASLPLHGDTCAPQLPHPDPLSQ